MLNVSVFLNRIHNKIFWIYKYKLKIPELQKAFLSMLKFRWVLHIGSASMDVSQKSALIISPHQDDEVLGCGGMIGLKRKMGIAVEVVFITDGAASHSWHPNFQAGEIVPVRRQEAITALGILGVDSAQIHFLNKPDSKLRYLNDNERQETIQQIVKLLQFYQPEEVYVPHRQDRTKDHEATYELVKEAIIFAGIEVDLLQYPIWLFWHSRAFGDLKLAELSGAYRLAIHHIIKNKQEAIAAYHSQCIPIDRQYSPMLKPAFLKRFNVPYEIFFKTDFL